MNLNAVSPVRHQREDLRHPHMYPLGRCSGSLVRVFEVGRTIQKYKDFFQIHWVTAEHHFECKIHVSICNIVACTDHGRLYIRSITRTN